MSKIVNIRGTSGSGKSTLVRQIMAQFTSVKPSHIAGRKRPISYLCEREGLKPLIVIGHYETDCGGTDTIPNMDEIYRRVRAAAGSGYNVLFEGLLSSAESRRTIELKQDGYDIRVVHIDIPLEECIASVEKRRAGAYQRKLQEYDEHVIEMQRLGKKPKKVLPKEPGPLNPKNTESKWKGTRSTVRRLEGAGIQTYKGDREYAIGITRMLLSES